MASASEAVGLGCADIRSGILTEGLEDDGGS